ncbi:hypothetical protein [Staphylococcus simulans]|uniref:hypothetical protein n=1 Tax=Staphylococcus simulans TaxID=1286 RepID=UPI0021CE5D4D|nr:hypothetical protein [Staphylococcus simulans]UXV37156.1 hypothetical protein MUA87_10245 [Staphylococcus simulans]UXV39605.1 hypothetical protein MUA56_10245 [Staphylococcus simulans]
MLDPANESVKRIFKCNNRNELLNKYFKLLDEYFLYNFIFYEEDKDNERIYGFVVYTKIKLGDEVNDRF